MTEELLSDVTHLIYFHKSVLCLMHVIYSSSYYRIGFRANSQDAGCGALYKNAEFLRNFIYNSTAFFFFFFFIICMSNYKLLDRDIAVALIFDLKLTSGSPSQTTHQGKIKSCPYLGLWPCCQFSLPLRSGRCYRR